MKMTISERINWLRNNKPKEWDGKETEFNSWDEVCDDIERLINSYGFNNPIYGGDPNIDLEIAQHQFLTDCDVPENFA